MIDRLPGTVWKGMRWFLSSELGTNCIEWANVLRLIFLWYALKAIMSQSYFNGPTTRSLNLQILYFSFLPVMEPLRAGWLFFLHTAAKHCFTVVFSLSFQYFIFYLLCFLLLWLNLCLVSKVVIETQVTDTHDAQAQASEVRGACQIEGWLVNTSGVLLRHCISLWK